MSKKKSSVMASLLKLWLLSGLVIALLALATCKTFIESDLTERTAEIFSTYNFTDVGLSVNGRDIEVSVDESELTQKNRLISAVSQVYGVRSANVITRPEPPLAERAEKLLLDNGYEWARISTDDKNNLEISGTTNRQDDIKNAQQLLYTLNDVNFITNKIEYEPNLESEIEAILARENAMNIQAVVEEDKVTLTGEIVNQSSLDTIISQIRQLEGVSTIDNRAESLSSDIEPDATESNNDTSDDLTNLSNIVISPDECQTQLNETLARQTILFAVNSTNLTTESQQLVKVLATIIGQCPESNLQIAGYTDSTGSAQGNQRISQQRAESVKTHLVQNGIDAERLTSVGFGEENPVADNATAEGRRKNRRIEITILTE